MSGTFRYANPAMISYGEGCLDGLANAVTSLGARRLFLVSTPPVLDNPVIMDLLFDSLPVPLTGAVGIGGHAPLEDVDTAITMRYRLNVDLVISLGGGSAIDAAKGVARGALAASARVGAAAKPGDIGTQGNLSRIPHIAIPTTLAAAELSWRAGFSDSVGDKVGFADKAMLPAQVFYEPRLAVHTPIMLWLATGIRAIDHAVEGYLAEGDHPFSNVLAVEAIARLDQSLRTCVSEPSNTAARGDAQIAAWFSYTLPLASMTGLSHQLGKQIGARHGIGHGDTSALLLPHVMRYRAEREPERFQALSCELDRRIGDGRTLSAADRVGQLIQILGLPQHLEGFGLTRDDLLRAADEVATDEYPNSDLAAIYLEAW